MTIFSIIAFAWHAIRVFAMLEILVLAILAHLNNALLSVQQNECRQLDSLDGLLWTFVREPPNSGGGIGLLNGWAALDLSTFENASLVPVPAAFNDLTADKQHRDHVGWVWYQHNSYYLSNFMSNNESPIRRRSFIRFGSVQYYAIVFLNGQKVGAHVGGHLPFQIELLQLLAGVNTITVAVNNTLSDETIPPGDFKIIELSRGRKIVENSPNFDFFNYAGILRPVHIWHLPPLFISGIQIQADSSGRFSYRLAIDCHADQPIGDEEVQARVTVYELKDRRKLVGELSGLQNTTQFTNISVWWPKGMGGKPTLYIAEVTLTLANDTHTLLDIYRETFGFRTVTFDDKQIYVNGRPFYCHGFGMHEDFTIHGRGFDRATMVKDLNMFGWLNGNCYRTSHYPYSEERAHLADELGIAVITEVPAVGLRIYNRSLQQLHAKMITEMVTRDQNHPSVIMWSLANEPAMSANSSAFEYFSELIALTKALDATRRPVTLVFGHVSQQLKVASLLDVICVNEYFGWYQNLGILESVQDHLVEQIRHWRCNFSKPVILSEYGAEAIPGFNEYPSRPFTEQYQVELIEQTGAALDVLRGTNDIAGEMLWNFADFMTAPYYYFTCGEGSDLARTNDSDWMGGGQRTLFLTLTRPLGNHKGVLTRDRQPKMGAFAIRKRYAMLLMGNLSGGGMPEPCYCHSSDCYE